MASETEPADIDIDTEIWNERSETRTKVLRRLKAVIKDRLNHDTVPVTFWAFCQVADISKLEELIERAESTRGTEYLKEPLLYKIILSDDIVDKWLRKTPGLDEKDSANPEREVVDNCKKRDNNSCVLTGHSLPAGDVVHIYPLNLVHQPEIAEFFWHFLSIFWNSERVESWKKAIFNDVENLSEPRDELSNMICLGANAKLLWENAHFALRPLEQSPDQSTMKIQLFWQKPISDGIQRVDLLKIPRSSRGYHDEFSLCNLARPDTILGQDGVIATTNIKSGDIFTLTTSDPVNLPLQSWPLLEMQWYLQRVAGMSGKTIFDPDDEEELYPEDEEESDF